MADPLDPAHLIGHVKDAEYFEVPRLFSSPEFKSLDEVPQTLRDAHPGLTLAEYEHEARGKIFLPQPMAMSHAVHLPTPFQPLDLRLTKFMVLELVGAVLILLFILPMARKTRGGGRPAGRLWNMFEALLVFLRDEVARPAIGKHDADKFLPFLWTMFFFVLTCNLLGLLPWLGSPTGALATTAVLAIITFIVVIGSGMMKMGVSHFWTGLVPHMDLPPALMFFLWPMIFAIEILGLLIKHFVLAVRLLANMFAGHLVLAVILAFILATADNLFLWAGVMPVSVLGATALNLLELLVAFIQAYIFTFLAALFIGMAVHPH
jgi:F-type H+-transporting ATPase subunit a